MAVGARLKQSLDRNGMNENEFNNPPSPYGHPLRMIDRVESLDIASAKLTARKVLSRNEPLLQGHFPTFLIMPGILQLESMAQASALLLKAIDAKDPMLRMIIVESRLKHMLPVVPGDTLLCETQLITRKDPFYTFRGSRNCRQPGSGQGANCFALAR